MRESNKTKFVLVGLNEHYTAKMRDILVKGTSKKNIKEWKGVCLRNLRCKMRNNVFSLMNERVNKNSLPSRTD